MTKKKLLISSALLLVGLGSYDLYKMKFVEGNKIEDVVVKAPTSVTAKEKADYAAEGSFNNLESEVLDEGTESTEENTKKLEAEIDDVLTGKEEYEEFKIEELEEYRDTGLEDIVVDKTEADSVEINNDTEPTIIDVKPKVILDESTETSLVSEISETPKKVVGIEYHDVKGTDSITENVPTKPEPKIVLDEVKTDNKIPEGKVSVSYVNVNPAIEVTVGYKDKLSFYEEKVVELRKAEDKIRKELVMQEISTGELNETLIGAKQRNEDLKKEISDLNALIVELRKKNKEDVSKIYENVKGYTEQLSKNQKEMVFLNSKNNELTQVIREKSQTILDLNKQIDEKYKEVQLIQQKLNDKTLVVEKDTQSIQLLETRLRKANSSIEALKIYQRDLESNVRAVKNMKNETDERIKDFSLRNNDVEKMLLKKESEIDDKNKEITFLKEKIETTLGEKEDRGLQLNKIIAQKEAALTKLNEGNKIKVNEIKGLLGEIDQLKEVLDLTRNKRDELKMEVSASSKKQNNLLEIIKLKEDNNNASNRELLRVKTKNEKLGRQLEELKKEKLSIQFKQQMRLSELNSKMKELEVSYKDKLIDKEFSIVEVANLNEINDGTESYNQKIEKLSHSKNEKILEQLARNPRMGGDVLVRLSKNESIYVRNAVAKNPNITEEVMRRLAKDNVGIIKMALLDNPNIQKSIIKDLIGDEDSRVSKYAELKWNMIK